MWLGLWVQKFVATTTIVQDDAEVCRQRRQSLKDAFCLKLWPFQTLQDGEPNYLHSLRLLSWDIWSCLSFVRSSCTHSNGLYIQQQQGNWFQIFTEFFSVVQSPITPDIILCNNVTQDPMKFILFHATPRNTIQYTALWQHDRTLYDVHVPSSYEHYFFPVCTVIHVCC